MATTENTVTVKVKAALDTRDLAAQLRAAADQLDPPVPTVGRTVHYQCEHPPGPQAAVITEVTDVDVVGLAVLNPSGMFFNRNVLYSQVPRPGYWSWPPVEQHLELEADV